MFSECFKLFLVLFDIWAENRMFEPRTGFSKFIKKPQNMFSWCFLSVSWYFSIIRHLSREPDFSAKNRIFKNFLRCLIACLVGVFWVFQSIFSIVRHLGREPDFWAEHRIFKNFFKSLKTCLVGVFCVLCFKVFYQSSKSEPRTTFLSREPDFQEYLKKHQNMVFFVFSGCFKVFF